MKTNHFNRRPKESQASPRTRDVLAYIKSQRWFFGVRADESLLFYSAKRKGYTKYIKNIYGTAFAETLLIPLKANRPLRVFNLRQAKKFHAISQAKILRNPHVLESFITKNDQLYQDIARLGKKLLGATNRDDQPGSIKIFHKLIDRYEIASAQFIIIFSLGLKLTENRNGVKNAGEIINQHNRWRNSLAFREEALGKDLFYFFRFVIRKRRLSATPLSLMKFLTANEIEAWLGKKIPSAKIENLIWSRTNRGYIYLNLRRVAAEVIDNRREIAQIRKYFLGLHRQSQPATTGQTLHGQVAFRARPSVHGKVVVIKDKSELKKKGRLIKGKILIAIQTTPHYIPYIKGGRAIVTDEGGLTCHAAIVARELRIPGIVGTGNATQLLRDSDQVDLDLTQGTIHIRKSK